MWCSPTELRLSRRKAVHPRRGWSIFYAQAFTAPISIGLGVNVSYSSNEIGMTHTWSVTIGNEAGIPIIPEMKGQLQIPQLLSGLPSAAVNRVPFDDADQSRGAGNFRHFHQQDRLQCDLCSGRSCCDASSTCQNRPQMSREIELDSSGSGERPSYGALDL